MSERLRNPQYEKLLEQFPNPLDWEKIQGGRPRVFRDPNQPRSRWIVLHVYDEHDTPEKRFASGMIVDTIPRQKLQLVHIGFEREDPYGNQVRRNVLVPSFMLRNLHGEPCDERSRQVGGETTARITRQFEYEAFIHDLQDQDYEELRWRITQQGYTLAPGPIRDPRPLGEE